MVSKVYEFHCWTFTEIIHFLTGIEKKTHWCSCLEFSFVDVFIVLVKVICELKKFTDFLCWSSSWSWSIKLLILFVLIPQQTPIFFVEIFIVATDFHCPTVQKSLILFSIIIRKSKGCFFLDATLLFILLLFCCNCMTH